MATTRGFTGRPRTTDLSSRIPPGQHLEKDFPVLSAGPTPRIRIADWTFTLKVGPRPVKSWSWTEFNALPTTQFTRVIHCVTTWTKLDTAWEGVSVDTLLEEVESAAEYVLAFCDGGYTTNLPLEDVTDGKAWIAYGYDGEPKALQMTRR